MNTRWSAEQAHKCASKKEKKNALVALHEGDDPGTSWWKATIYDRWFDKVSRTQVSLFLAMAHSADKLGMIAQSSRLQLLGFSADDNAGTIFCAQHSNTLDELFPLIDCNL